MMYKITFVSIILLLFAHTIPSTQKKIIREGKYDIECYVASKSLKKYKEHKVYFWYKSREVHNSKGMSGGQVLDGEFKKFFKSNQLAEQGYFDMGLKKDRWYTWFENGQTKSITNWKKGLRHGNYKEFDSLGNLVLTGKFKKNEKHGKWINYKSDDTIKYKRGKIIIKKIDSTKSGGFFRKLFRSKKRDSLPSSKNDTLKKRGFFKKLFSKKNKDTEINKPKKEENGFFKRIFGNKESEKAKKR